MAGKAIAIASGKGGVGKTTITANFGLALAKLGKKVIMVDADLDMANLELVLGMEGRPITLKELISGEAEIEDVMYEVTKNAWFVPAGISPQQFKRVDPEKLIKIINQFKEKADYVLVDCPAGIGRDTIACFAACKQTILVITPEPMSATDGYKTLHSAEKMGSDLKGIILNMIKKEKGELSEKDITSLFNSPILARIKEDEELKKSVLQGKPLMKNKPNNESAQEIMKMAANEIGVPFTKKIRKGGLFSNLFKFLKKK